MAEIFSSRNQLKFSHNGYMYIKRGGSKDGKRTFWQCDLMVSPTCCKGRIHTTNNDNGNPEFLEMITPHTCNEAANAARIEVQKAVCQIKQRALMTMENPEQIRNAVIAEVPEIVLENFPSSEATRKLVQRIRKSEGITNVDKRARIIPQQQFEFMYGQETDSAITKQQSHYSSQSKLENMVDNFMENMTVDVENDEPEHVNFNEDGMIADATAADSIASSGKSQRQSDLIFQNAILHADVTISNESTSAVRGGGGGPSSSRGRKNQNWNNTVKMVRSLYLECFNEADPCITVIGGGKMAMTLVQGFVKEGCFSQSNVFICTRTAESALRWKRLGYPCAYASDEFYTKTRKRTGIVLIAVPPQSFPEFLNQIAQHEWFYFAAPELLCVSIMAGISLQHFQEQLKAVGFEGHTARLMPNLNCAVSAGVLLVSAHPNTTPREYVKLLTVLGSTVGYCVRVDETRGQFDAASAISGCGPAFISMVIEAIADGGVLSGLSRDLATRLALETVKGTAQYLLDSTSTSPAQLKDKVCSPGGTTIAGVRVLERGAMRSAFIEAINASAQHASELSEMMNGREMVLQNDQINYVDHD